MKTDTSAQDAVPSEEAALDRELRLLREQSDACFQLAETHPSERSVYLTSGTAMHHHAQRIEAALAAEREKQRELLAECERVLDSYGYWYSREKDGTLTRHPHERGWDGEPARALLEKLRK